MICMAIASSPGKELLLSEICDFLKENFAYYREKGDSWNGAIRHNLSLHRSCFVKGRQTQRPNKGCYWRLHENAKHMYRHGTLRRRRERNLSSARASTSSSSNHQESQQSSSSNSHRNQPEEPNERRYTDFSIRAILGFTDFSIRAILGP